MDKSLSLFNQINSLSYWFLHQTNFKSNVSFDAEKDELLVSVRKDKQTLYTYCVSMFSKKNKSYLEFELKAIVNQLLYFKDYADNN